MSVIDELNHLLNFNKKLSKKIEKLFKRHLTYDEYMYMQNHIKHQAKYLKPTYDYDDFERQRDMVSCIFYSTIGQESMDWVKEWSDIPYEMFMGAEPDSYEYEQIKLFIEGYYELLKETGKLKLFVDEAYHMNKQQEKAEQRKQQLQSKYPERIEKNKKQIENLQNTIGYLQREIERMQDKQLSLFFY